MKRTINIPPYRSVLRQIKRIHKLDKRKHWNTTYIIYYIPILCVMGKGNTIIIVGIYTIYRNKHRTHRRKRPNALSLHK